MRGRCAKGFVAGIAALAVPLTFGLATPANAADSDGDGIPNKFESAGWWDSPNNQGGALQQWTDKNFPTACNNDTSAPAWQAVLVYPPDDDPQVQTVSEKVEFRRIVSRAESIFAASAEKVLNDMADVKQSRAPRWTTFTDQTGKCAPILGKTQIPKSEFPRGCETVNGSSSCDPAEGDVSPSSFFDYMETQQGKNDPNRKYIYFMQNPYPQAAAGTAQSNTGCDWDKTAANCSNDMGHVLVNAPSIFANYWGNEADGKQAADTIAHEMAHNLGAVGYNSPDRNPYNGAHSKDCWDLLCYPLTADTTGQTYDSGCGTEGEEESKWTYRLDCGHDGSFNADNPTTGYLSTHWNVADNSFLWGGLPQSAGASRSTSSSGSEIIVD